MKLQLRHLHYFIAVAEELNFHKAAKRVFVSQPTLSHQIAQLEELLEVKLLIRDKRSASLTAAGKLLYNKALLILDTVDVSITQVKALAETQPLTIGVPSYHSFDIVSKILHKFIVEHPSITLDVKEMTALEMNTALNNRQLDIGFLSLPFPLSNNPNLQLKSIAKEEYLLCLSKQHPEANAPFFNAKKLSQENFIMLPRDIHPSFHDFILSQLNNIGVNINIVAEATSTQAQYSLAAAEMGICLALESSPIPESNLVVKPIKPPVLQHELTICWHKENQRQAVEYFLACAGYQR